MRTDGIWFKDEAGRALLLRGANLGGSTKVPPGRMAQAIAARDTSTATCRSSAGRSRSRRPTSTSAACARGA
jgi:hypothetical protein